ncbi:nucleotidyltransferase domain-containing protein [Kitasatospora sp. NRRL B-11411]|uniref:nucleotidyltransferase domain-containing protein n=1 Tax=Kitasatospora sp. NRRL B-11411 TaxID=1463822 RepID=UPI0004C3094D|nr:nucleotidyltransferase domain-containing protein [Kitasatospora sp. NRRL B-11411]
MTGAQAVLAASRATAEIFGDDLLCSFVGGSYARGSNKPTSDIDLFVVTARSNHGRERLLAERLRDLHLAAGLDFDHCGEILTLDTLDTLLAFTEHCIAAVPAIQRSACYLADCPLSVFRKGDVVFKFLADPKTAVHDPAGLLPALEARAAAYFSAWPMPRIQPHKGLLRLPSGSPQQQLADLWRNRDSADDWTDTPVGIGLERWFGTELPARSEALRPAGPVTVAPPDGTTCPLPAAGTTLAQLLAAQCLAFLHSEPEGHR